MTVFCEKLSFNSNETIMSNCYLAALLQLVIAFIFINWSLISIGVVNFIFRQGFEFSSMYSVCFNFAYCLRQLYVV